MPDVLKERAAAAGSVHEKRYPAPPVDVVNTDRGWVFSSPYRSADEEEWWRLLGEAFGTRTKAVVAVFMDQIAGLVSSRWSEEAQSACPDQAELQAALSIVASLKPKNEAEAAHAAQAVALHLVAMKVGKGLSRHASLDVDPRQANALANLVKAYSGTIDSMRKGRRSNSTRQTLTVKKDVRITYNDRRSVTLGGGGQPSDEQSDGADEITRARASNNGFQEGRTCAVEVGPTLRCAPEADVGALPCASDAKFGGVPVTRGTRGGR